MPTHLKNVLNFLLFIVLFVFPTSVVYQKHIGHAPAYTYKQAKLSRPPFGTIFKFILILFTYIYRYPRETMKFRVRISTS